MHNEPDPRLVSMLVDGFQNQSPSARYHLINDSDKKATHSEIEKRRRQKMNKYLNELVQYLPVSSSKHKKMDKISILKTAVNHMKNLKASSSILSDSFICQNYISAVELQSLILKDSEDFLVVIKCDSGKILYVSDSCQKSLGISSSELTDKVFFELVHPSDAKQVKDQLVYTERGNSSHSGQSLVFNQYRNLNTGVRRSFHCRVKLGFPRSENDTRESLMELKKPEYKVVNFNGYLRSGVLKNLDKTSSLSPSDSTKLMSRAHSKATKLSANDNGQVTQYLIAYGHSKQRATSLINFEFISRLDMDGKFVFVDPGVNLLLGHLPHQLLSESIFNHVHPDDAPMLKKSFQEALNSPQQRVFTQPYRLKLESNVRANSYITVETVFYALSNPSSCQLEYVLAQNKLSNIADLASTALGIQSSNRPTSISMPMTPSPEEISYANSDSLSEKASPTKSAPNSNLQQAAGQTAFKQSSRIQANQQNNPGYNVADSQANSTQAVQYYTNDGRSSLFRKADFAQPNKHTPFASNYEYVQNEHAYSSMGESLAGVTSDPNQAQYGEYNNQMQYSQAPVSGSYMQFNENSSYTNPSK